MISSYGFGRLMFEYVRWHYGRGFGELLDISRNFFSFLTHFFSLKLLLKTFFMPLQKMGESYKGGLNIESALSTLAVNIIMRAVGAFARSVIITAGLIALVGFTVLAFASSIIWLLAPLIIISLLTSSLFLIL
jgi:hypothetical protein